jgi:CspA family cold shock protein
MERDLIRRCVECGIDFVWTVTEQAADPQPELCAGCRKLAPPAGRQRGLVKWYSRGKSYGFITPVTGADVFVHKSALAGGTPSLRAGQLVEFGLSHGKRGAQAEQVTVLGETPAGESVPDSVPPPV